MSSFNFNAIGDSLKEASQKTDGVGVSFAGKALKLNTEEDAKEVTEAIEKCKDMEYLDLEGNTLGPDAAKAVSEAIEKHGAKLKRALWKDMFTGRMKDEIPVALEHLGRGLCAAGTQLVELDLSDNAFGPIGVKGLAALLSSSACYTLQELKLNNNGLGITGGKLLAKALMDCHSNSLRDTSKPFALKVFIAGRNRLENDGATALAEVFKKLTTLEEVVMPQNGIYHPGITALADGLSTNQGSIADAVADKSQLTFLALDGNAFGEEGRAVLVESLKNSDKIESLGAMDEDDDDNDENSEEGEDDTETDDTKSDVEEDESDVSAVKDEQPTKILTVQEFLKAPTGDNFLKMQGDKSQAFAEHIRSILKSSNEDKTNDVIKVIMKVSALCASGYIDVRVPAEQVTERLYSELFKTATENNRVPSLNNALLVNLGLLKSEDKAASKIDWNLEGCFKALEKVCQRDYFLPQTRDTLKVFIDKPMKQTRVRVVDPFQAAKDSLKTSLGPIQST
ncbi:hypothetical protein QAD02_009143 [Eretmocerus hayati]|uniref:Uncharacterized protein n=1 Tax=Eretmocerus hayati TaxID=131215 RepID=A0ACC2N8G3_9HYME|nr:hypothetical protein QAD02_009143 [Eretmocerus hayati]